MTELIYLDYASTSPLDPRVKAEMLKYMGAADGFGNPSSATHAAGLEAQGVVDAAAQAVATLINADAGEIVWTSGATEADNLAILGAARFRKIAGNHIVTSAIEHKAVLESCAALEREGFEVTYLKPDATGRIAAEAVQAALRPSTTLVSVMHANNEIGAINDVAAIGSVCRSHGALFHVDAAQSAGKVPIDVVAQQIDMLSLSAHKACGPKGIGVLYLNRERIPRVEPLMYGGGQQRGIRPGTLAVHQIAGMGETMRILGADMQADVAHIAGLRERLRAGLAAMPGISFNGPDEAGLCSILNVRVADVEGESLLYALQELAVASGSACTSASGEASYVLRSLGLPDHEAEASIRLSLGRFSTAADVDAALRCFAAALAQLRSLSPVFEIA